MGKKSTTYWKDLLYKFGMRKHEVKISSPTDAYKHPGAPKNMEYPRKG